MSISATQYSPFIRCLVALVLALNALGWAAHVDVPIVSGQALADHGHVTANSEPVDPQSGGAEQTAPGEDHCGHADGHQQGLLGLAAHARPSVKQFLATPACSAYISLVHTPYLRPPIA